MPLNRSYVLAGLCATLFLLGGVRAQAQAKNQVKVQKQLSGMDAKFGTIYSLKSLFNFEVLAASYTFEPLNSYMDGTIPAQREKLIVFDVAIKNARDSDNFFNSEVMGIQVVDDKQTIYQLSSISQQSMKNRGISSNLKPGQGIGQKALNDPVRLAFRVPYDAVITKLIIGVGRLYTSEKLLRYNLIPYGKATATNKNFATPLPENTRDSSDPYGAVALQVGKAKIGEAVPSQALHITVDDVSTPVGVTFNGKPADAGKKFIVATITFKNMLINSTTMFNVLAGGAHTYVLKDADGDPYEYMDTRKKSTDEPIPDRRFEEGETYTFRMFFQVPAPMKPTQLQFGSFGHLWSIDLPS